jgi:2-polyprenyl-6-methoxyphenol hydroxylase-like FAD-dependent oxidoreductase
MSPDRPDRVPVLIAGGGIVGLSASLFLSRQEVPSLLVERHPGTSIHPRSRGVNGRTMELYRELGIDERVREAGRALAPALGLYVGPSLLEIVEPLPRERKVGHNPFTQVLEDLSPVSASRGTQDLIEPVLVEAARERGGDLRFHTQLRGFEQDGEGVTATLFDRDRGEEWTVHADHMIAADGANSGAFHALGAPCSGAGVLGHMLNILFRLDLTDLVRGREFSICDIERPELRGLMTSINNTDRWVFHLVYRPSRGERAEDYTASRCVELLRLALGMPDADPEILGILPWEPTVRVADRFRWARVFLAGDAAHQMPPWGGQGANTGIQDVHNLAWKLAAVRSGTAQDALLDTYDEERRPVGRVAAEESGMAAGEDGMMLLQGGGEAIRQRWPRMIGYGYQYRSRAISHEPGDELPTDELGLDGRPGTRCPHAWVERPDGTRVSTLDLGAGGWTLLAASDGTAWCEAAAARDLTAYRIGPDGDVGDADDAWRARAGLEPDGALLIRPDGFVAWRARTAETDPAGRLGEALDRALCRTPATDRAG